ncbi:hypothetical protein BEL04_14395 [Mucilaginibacter sp. PPCGB 2223]|nr:hypothetical protein BEL04_14395 [Mucilaginibacter sp. PPCGB 2223]
MNYHTQIEALIPAFFSVQDGILILFILIIPILLLVYLFVSLQRKKEQTALLNQILTELRILNTKK